LIKLHTNYIPLTPVYKVEQEQWKELILRIRKELGNKELKISLQKISSYKIICNFLTKQRNQNNNRG